MDTHMMVSIILPTYNGASRIDKSIESVLAQTFTDWELIVVDDGSTQDIQSILPMDPRIRYIKNDKNLGIQKTLNRGLVEAKGKYIARIDDDDVWNDANKLEKQVAFLESHADHVLVGTGVIVVNEQGKELQRYLLPETDQSIRTKLLQKNCFAHASVMFRNNGFRYSEDMSVRHVEDYELWLRLGRIGKFVNIPAHCVTLMVHTDSLTARNRVVQAKRILKLSWNYRQIYPNALFGICISLARYFFFTIQSVVPFPSKFVYWIQSKQKSM